VPLGAVRVVLSGTATYSLAYALAMSQSCTDVAACRGMTFAVVDSVTCVDGRCRIGPCLNVRAS
jgi:hypothetical protein